MKDWSYFDKFEQVNDKYLPSRGEGNNKASQICTAVNKLVYKWYNDGDVFDNTYFLEGWANDLSSYANWLAKNADGAKVILDGIEDCPRDSDYEDLLAELADTLLDEENLEVMKGHKKEGSIYDCEGEYRFIEYDEDEDEEW